MEIGQLSIAGIDLWLFHAVNSFCGQSYLLDQIVIFFASNNFVKTIPFIVCVWILWLQPQSPRQRREIITATVVAVILALAITRGLANILPFRVRPYLAPDIGFQAPIIDYNARDVLRDSSSFPSDHATFFFAMTTGLWFISRRLGALFGLFSLLIILQRIYLGFHFPSDILAGALIGILCVMLVNRKTIRRYISAPILWVHAKAPTLYNAAFFVVLFEFGDLFDEVRQILKGSIIVLRHYGISVT